MIDDKFIIELINYLNEHSEYVNSNKITKKFNIRMSSLLRILTSMEELNIIEKKLINNIVYVRIIREMV